MSPFINTPFSSSPESMRSIAETHFLEHYESLKDSLRFSNKLFRKTSYSNQLLSISIRSLSTISRVQFENVPENNYIEMLEAICYKYYVDTQTDRWTMFKNALTVCVSQYPCPHDYAVTNLTHRHQHLVDHLMQNTLRMIFHVINGKSILLGELHKQKSVDSFFKDMFENPDHF